MSRVSLAYFIKFCKTVAMKLRVYLGVRTCEIFLCFRSIGSRYFVVLVVLCVTSLVSFTGSYTKDEPKLNIREEITSMDLNDKIIALIQRNMFPGRAL